MKEKTLFEAKKGNGNEWNGLFCAYESWGEYFCREIFASYLALANAHIFRNNDILRGNCRVRGQCRV